jgi:hypothetical protein
MDELELTMLQVKILLRVSLICHKTQECIIILHFLSVNLLNWEAKTCNRYCYLNSAVSVKPKITH